MSFNISGIKAASPFASLIVFQSSSIFKNKTPERALMFFIKGN